MKILVCHNYYRNRGGEEEVLQNEKKILEAHGHSVVLHTRSSKEIYVFTFLKKVKLFFSLFYSFETSKKIKDIVKKEKPDVAHIHNVFPLISPSVYYALKKLNVPVVQTVHNYRLMCANGLFLRNNGEVCEVCKKGNHFYGVIFKCYRNKYVQSLGMGLILLVHRLLGTFFRKIDIYVTPSNFVKNKLIESGFSDDKVIVKPHMIYKHKNSKQQSPEQYVLFMGRLSKEKGVVELLKAWKEIKGAKLKIVGEGNIKKDLESIAKRENIKNVCFEGGVYGEERFEIYRNALFTVIPAKWYETFCLVALESFSLGKPVVASKIGALSEIIENEKNGLFADIENKDDLAGKIQYLIDNPGKRNEMGNYALSTIEKQYSPEKNYDLLIGIYKKAIGNQK